MNSKQWHTSNPKEIVALVKVTIPDNILDIFRNRNDERFRRWEDCHGEGGPQDSYSGQECDVMIMESEIMYHNKIWLATLTGNHWAGIGNYGGWDCRRFYFPKNYCEVIQELNIDSYSEFIKDLCERFGSDNRLEYKEKYCRICNGVINKDTKDGLCNIHSKLMDDALIKGD